MLGIVELKGSGVPFKLWTVYVARMVIAEGISIESISAAVLLLIFMAKFSHIFTVKPLTINV